jgi:hypothetical protein
MSRNEIALKRLNIVAGSSRDIYSGKIGSLSGLGWSKAVNPTQMNFGILCNNSKVPLVAPIFATT